MAPPRNFAFLLLASLLGVHAHEAVMGLSNAGEAYERSLVKAWGRQLENSQEPSPVKRVRNLLEKMKAELTEEAENEAQMYDKMVCWCETNEKEKTKAIKDAEAKDIELSAEIESRSASFGEAGANMESLKEQIAEDTAALKKATAIREKEAAEFMEEEKDQVQAITNLRNAVNVLGKHQGGSSLMQLEKSEGPLVDSLKVTLRSVALTYEMMVAGSADTAHRGATLLQEAKNSDKSTSFALSRVLRDALDSHGGAVSEMLSPEYAEIVVAKKAAELKDRRSSASFLQQGHQGSSKQAPTAGSYQTASDGIFGIMTQMLEEFQASLATAQKDEKRAQEDFNVMSKAKEEQIAVAKEKLDEMEENHADNIKALSDAKEDLALTRKQRSEDVKFLRNLKLTCDDLDAQWEKRSATRAAEIKAVSETLMILTEDDNMEQLNKAASFMQVGAKRAQARRQAARTAAAQSLQKAAEDPDFDADDLLDEWDNRNEKKSGSKSKSSSVLSGARAQLSTLALTVQLDSFTKVKKAMDDMVAELKNEQKEEVEFKAYCIKEIDETDQNIYKKDKLKDELYAKSQSLKKLIAKLGKEIAKAKKQIADTQVAIKKASQSREAENKEFQQVVADQRAVQTILNKALMRLKDFYVKGKGKALLQKRAVQTPPVQFNKMKDNAGASPVMGLLEQIIGDSKQLEKECTDAEYKAQADYEKFVKDSTTLIEDLTESITVKTKASAQAKKDNEETMGYLGDTMDELESLELYSKDMHGQCDWVLKNFDIRQKARLQEIEAIGAAKGILSGAE